MQKDIRRTQTVSGYRGFPKRKRDMKDGRRERRSVKEGGDAGCKAGAHAEGDSGVIGAGGESSPREGAEAGRQWPAASAIQTSSHSQSAGKF